MIEHEKIQPKGETGGSGEKDAKETQECPVEVAVNEQIIGDVAEKSGAGAEENVTERFTDKPTEQPVKERDIEETCAVTAPEVPNNEDQLQQASNELQDETEHAADQYQQGTKPEEYALVETTRDYIKFTPSVPITYEAESKEENEVFDTHPLETKPEEVLSECAPVTYEAESKEENEVFDTHPLETKPEEVLSECAPIETNIPINYDAESDSEQSRKENEVCDIHPLEETRIEEILFEYAPTETSVPINYDEKSSSEQSREENEVLGTHAFETKLEEILFEYAPVETSIPIDYDAESGSKQSREENEVFTTHSLENKIEEVLFEDAPIETSVPINNCDAKSSRVDNNVLDTSPLDINNELTDQEAIDVVLIN